MCNLNQREKRAAARPEGVRGHTSLSLRTLTRGRSSAGYRQLCSFALSPRPGQERVRGSGDAASLFGLALPHAHARQWMILLLLRRLLYLVIGVGRAPSIGSNAVRLGRRVLRGSRTCLLLHQNGSCLRTPGRSPSGHRTTELTRGDFPTTEACLFAATRPGIISAAAIFTAESGA